MAWTCHHGFVHHDNVGRCPRCTHEASLEAAADETARLLGDQLALQREQAARGERQVRDLKRENAELRASGTVEARRREEFTLCLRSARQCLAIGEISAAGVQVEQAAALLPAEPELYDVRAEVAAARGDVVARVEALDKAWRLGGDRDRGLAYAAALEPAAGERLLEMLHERDNQDLAVGVALVASLLRRGEGESVARSLRILCACTSGGDDLDAAYRAVPADAQSTKDGRTLGQEVQRERGIRVTEAARQKEEALRRQREVDAATRATAENAARAETARRQAEAQAKARHEEAERARAAAQEDARLAAERAARRSKDLATFFLVPVFAAIFGVGAGVMLAPVAAVLNDFAAHSRGDGSWRSPDFFDENGSFFDDSPCGRGCRGGFQGGLFLGGLLGAFIAARREDL